MNARYETETRANLRAWAAWRAGEGMATPQTNCIEAVYNGGHLAPKLQEALTLAYLDPRQMKAKIPTKDRTVYATSRRLAEDAVEHLVVRLTRGEIA